MKYCFILRNNLVLLSNNVCHSTFRHSLSRPYCQTQQLCSITSDGLVKSISSNAINIQSPVYVLSAKDTRRQLSTTSTSSNSVKDGFKPDLSRDPSLKPTNEQLLLLKEKLTDHLPKFLEQTHPYALYSPDIIFENFYKEPGKITVGALPYALQLTYLKWKIHFRYSHAKFQVLKITHDDTDGTIKVRWRINGVRGIKAFQPWRIKFWNISQTIKQEAEWIDGFSILFVRGDGVIYKHRIDRVMPQQEEKEKVKVLDKALNLGQTI